MKKIIIILAVLLIELPFLSQAQSWSNSIQHRDSVCFDSVELVNTKILKRIESFYNQNIKQIDTNSYFVIEQIPNKESKPLSATLIIYLGCDIDNDLQMAKTNNSCFFKIHSSLVLIPIMEDSLKLFRKTGKTKIIHFNRKERVMITTGITRTQVGYYIYMTTDGIIKVRKKFYFRHECSSF